jgi:hypothetical protein
VPSDYVRQDFVFGKDMLVEKMDQRIDITVRQKQVQERVAAKAAQ